MPWKQAYSYRGTTRGGASVAVKSSTWNVVAARDSCPIQSWSGEVWRSHSAQWAADNVTGSLSVSGRFNWGCDDHEERDVWPVLYTSLTQAIALGERIRHTSETTLSLLKDVYISRLYVELSLVLVACAPDGCHAVGVPGMDETILCGSDYAQAQAFARCARETVEALLIPTCTKFPEGNLIIFPDRLRHTSSVRVIDHVAPNLRPFGK